MLVTAVVTTYERLDLAKRAITSVLNQNHPKTAWWSLIVTLTAQTEDGRSWAGYGGPAHGSEDNLRSFFNALLKGNLLLRHISLNNYLKKSSQNANFSTEVQSLNHDFSEMTAS